ncbi:MAG: hypothetical protein HOY79_24275 [Streptomyces sp.]|nr:hypothetical protein [Streptomyces sp.]
MSATLHVCRYCDGLITDAADAVRVGYEAGNSGPGWNVWAHRAHAVQATQPDSAFARILVHILIARALRQSTTPGVAP